MEFDIAGDGDDDGWNAARTTKENKRRRGTILAFLLSALYMRFYTRLLELTHITNIRQYTIYRRLMCMCYDGDNDGGECMMVIMQYHEYDIQNWEMDSFHD